MEIVPFARALLWYIVQVRYCDLDNINSAMQTIWAQQSTSSMLQVKGKEGGGANIYCTV